MTSTLYSACPPPLRSALVSAYGARLLLDRRGPAFRSAKRLYRASAGWSREQLEAYQLQRLRLLLEWASTRSEFWRARIPRPGIGTLDELQAIAPLDKETLRTALPSATIAPRGVAVRTGGTTGTPLTVRFLRDDLRERFGFLEAWRETHGVRVGDRRATFSGRIVVPEGDTQTVARTNWLLRQRLYSTFHLSPALLPVYASDLGRFRPVFIDGFPSAIATVAAYLSEANIRLPAAPTVVFTTSETLYDHQRALIQSAFGCPVRNQYGSAEGAPLVLECPQGRLHYDLRTGVIEETPAGALVTSFTTRGTPLIRYAIGDVIRLDPTDSVCPCGSANPVVEVLAGREQDYLVSPQRGRVGVGLIDIFKKIPPIVREAQVHQLEIDLVELKIAADEGRFEPEHERMLRDGLRERLGDGITIRIVKVPAIEREASGKLRYLKRDPSVR